MFALPSRISRIFGRGGAAALAALWLVGCSSGSSTVVSPTAGAGGANDLGNPPEVVSSHGVAAVALQAAINPATGGPGIEFNGSFNPPTIRVSPGDSIDITYVNALPTSSAKPYNGTNLHFHGLSTSPNPPADDAIDILAMPGQTVHYVVPVPKTQPPGLYWYHSHAHGEANWQLYNGMSGAIVVNGIASFAPETAGLPERVIVLRNLLANPQFSELDRARRAFKKMRSVAGAGIVPPICQLPFKLTGEYTTINGQPVGAQMVMQPGQSQFWRVLNASPDSYFDLHVDGEMLRLVAIDGVPMKTYPGAAEQNVNDVQIPPAGRAEFIVAAPTGTAAFRTTCTDTGPGGDPNPPQVLATVVSGHTLAPAVPQPGSTPPASGTYQQPLTGTVAVARTLNFTEDDNGFYLNGLQYTPNGAPMFTAHVGTVEQWTLVNQTTEVHAFHIHQLHFIVQDVDGGPQPAVWRDTFSIPTAHADGSPSVTHVLMDFRDPEIRGTFLFHCHLLEHEDGGMMAKIAVQ